jgi:hypothetical protein
MRLGVLLLCSVAILALSGISSAAHGAVPTLRCAAAPCQYRIEGGGFYLRLHQLKIGCQATRGVGEMSSSATGTATISFSGCREEMTPFTFGCVNGGGPLGTIETNRLSTSVYEEGGKRELQFGGMRLDFVCGGFGKALHLEGFLAGEIGPRACDVAVHRFPMPTELIAHGREGTGANYDVYVDGYGDEQYEFSPPWRLEFEGSARFDC